MTKSITKQLDLWIASVVLLISIGLEWYGHACGLLITPDSLQYLSAAKSFSESRTFLNADGSYYSYWGPLFPILLSFFKSPLSALVWINVISKILIVVTLIQLVRSFIRDSILRIVFLIVSMIGVHTLLISVFVWSELIFMTLILWNAYFVIRTKESPSSYYWFLITGFFACLQRDAGFFWMCGVCLWLLFDNKTILKARIIQSAIFFLICTSGLTAWRVYVHFIMQQNSNFYDYSFFFHSIENARSVLLTFGKMLVPLNGIPGIAIGVLFFSLLVWSFSKSNRNMQLLGIIISVYTLGFLALPWQLDVNEMDRYFSVITPLIYLLILSTIDEKVKILTDAKRVSICIIVCVWLCYPLARTYRNVQLWHERSCASNNPK